ncbi:MAG: hypothetical protein WA708_10370 [Acidobacteriaceae bacterium]
MRAAVWSAIAFALFCATGCSASNNDFDAVVSGVEQRYSVHAQQVPLMGIISLCARATTLGGVKGMRIAEFDHVGKLDVRGLDSLMQSELGAQWQPMVTDRSDKRAELSVIFVRPAEDSMQMMIADYEHGELDVVRMELNGAALARWMHRPGSNVGVFHRSDLHPDRTD